MNKIEVGEFIRTKRKEQNMSQQQLAEKAGITRRQQIIEMESASTDYGIDVLIKVISALGHDVVIHDPTWSDRTNKEIETESKEEFGLFDFSKIEPATEESNEKLQKPKKKTNLANSKKANNEKTSKIKRRKTIATGKTK